MRRKNPLSRIASHGTPDENSSMNSSGRIPESVETALASSDTQSILDATIQFFGCQAGTVHWLDPQSGTLKLAAHRNIPPPIAEIVATVPIGKGIAGLAAQRREPVSLCNLQTDTSGQARPAAKTTGMEGSLAVPMLVSGELRGVLGIAKATPHDWTDEEKGVVLAIASKLGEKR
jgi:L-methionine (R)-S-oxide reductase